MSILSVSEAQALVYSQVPLRATGTHVLRELSGTVLAQTIQMERDQPPFDRVTMDGIAVNAQRAGGIRRLRISGTQAAGANPLALQHAEDCIEVMTGAQLPTGCDCVIPVERFNTRDGFAEIDATIQLTSGMNVHRRGSDALAGQTLLQPGMPLGAVEVAIIASAGHAQAVVRSSPRIALISTGDELVEPGQPIESFQIRRSNTYALHAALQQHGHTQIVDAHLPDQLDTLRVRLEQLLQQNEVLILSGGVSMGKFDFVPQVLTELGVRCVFHKIAQRPGKPLWFGTRDDGRVVYALPGNPVSTLICLHRYVLPGLAHSMNTGPHAPELIALASDAKAHDELSVFLPIKLQTDVVGVTRALPCPTRGSGDFISLLGTDGFVELPPAQGMISTGTVVSLFRW